MMTLNSTSGQAHPYWYEWFVGLIEVVKLLNPDEGIETVAFQVASILGWDDVVVTHANGKRFYQVKHTREKNNLTFGSLVEVDEKGNSLLGSLFEGAQKSGLISANNELVLYTNREDGSRWSTRDNGDRRPPLLEFWKWLKTELEKKRLAELSVPSDYSSAWIEWMACFKGNEDKATEFLNQLTIRTNEDDLDGLGSRVRNALATAFGISEAQAAPLFDALCRELRLWTTGHSGVTVEVLCEALTLEPAPKEFAPAPPPPSPFFPTRFPVAERLQSDLLDENEAPVVFLTGEPGSGKTSAVSWLANRRTDSAFQGIIGIRFFCFEPIRPEQPFIAPDASRVKPEELWYSLLTQLRRGLRGRLRELSVPLRNSFLSWIEAKDHVLRLADVLGTELGRRFVVSIDGIDHAARAAQVIPEQIAEFFASLPSPDEVASKRIRLFIAGQPPEYYVDQYPTWLTTEHQKVRRIDLPKLEQDDIRCLLQNSTTSINPTQIDEVVRLIDELSRGNTLSVVFAVAEAKACSSLGELALRLKERSLGDGLSYYYDSIWRHALRDTKELSCSLAGTISLARTAITAEQLSKIFAAWQKPAPWWAQVLTELGPLLVRERDGYLISHNDVRVFLAARFRGFTLTNQQVVVSDLANYFANKDSDRLAAHLQLFDLLKLANRTVETASLFDVDWVLEGSAIGLEVNHLLREGEIAVSELCNARNWSNVVSVCCALETLDRVSEYSENHANNETLQTQLPPFLATEASVRPINQWTKKDFRELVWDAHELTKGGAYDRARGLLTRWLGNFGIDTIVKIIPDFEAVWPHRIGQKNEPHLDDIASSDFEELGSICAQLGWTLWGNLTRESPRIERNAFFAFEKGFVNEVTRSPSVDTLEELFCEHKPRFLDNHELAIRNLVKAESWKLIAEVLESIKDNRDSYNNDFLLEASWYALRAGISSQSEWIIHIADAKNMLPKIPKHYIAEDINLTQFVNTARALGWTNTSLDTGDIAEIVIDAFEIPDEEGVRDATTLLFRTAAVLGRLEGQAARSNWDSASELFTPNYFRKLLDALWGDVTYGAHRFRGRLESSALAEKLAEYCGKLGGDFDKAALEVAFPLAREYVLGPRLNAIWEVVKRHGKIEVLRNWIKNYIADGGAVWSWSTPEARKTINDLVPLARSIGLDNIAEYAEKRAKWLIVGYISHKEYSFERVFNWFSDAANNDPTIWSDEGWKLWQLCRICDDRGGDNRLESKILTGISTSAIRAGKTVAWWRLISTTLSRRCERDWHYQTRQQFVDGYVDALAQGLVVDDDEIIPIWSMALCLSYWSDDGDTSSLSKLRNALLLHASYACRSEIDKAMQFGSSMISTRSKEDDSENAPPAIEKVSPDNPRDESDWWRKIDEFLQEQKREERHWGYANGLMSIAHRRARLYGSDELLSGLNIQLNMHTRWASGGGVDSSNAMSELPVPAVHTSDEVFVQFIKVLLDTFSVEATVAALEGLHSFVAQNPTIITVLFNEVSEEWPRRWLLNAAEAWAVLHPNELADANDIIGKLMKQGDLDSRLQAWIVLMRNAETLGRETPTFPLSDEAEMSIDEVEDVDIALLDIPPTMQGASRFANRYSAAHNMIQYCARFGFRFEKLEGLIAKKLFELSEKDDGCLRKRGGPHRYTDFTYVPADTEKAFGIAVLSILSNNWCDDSQIAELSQAVLPNEDSWIYRNRPKAIQSVDEWPAHFEYGGEKIDTTTRRIQMLNAARTASLNDGWKVFVAKAKDFTDNEDFEIHFWFEESKDTLLISAPKVPTCPGGRSFIWWIGEPFELELDRFVSGLFVGGRQRLTHCHFEIRPPRAWRDEFGWSPNPIDPREWFHEGEIVAKYERLHGVLRDAPHGPKYRQPFIDRWIITSTAFERIRDSYPKLRDRETFDIYTFRENGD